MARKQQDNAPAPAAQPAYTWHQALARSLVGGARFAERAGVCDVYKRGVVEVVRRLVA